MARLARPALAGGRLGGLRRLVDRPPDEIEQRRDRDLQPDHQIDKRPAHPRPRNLPVLQESHKADGPPVTQRTQARSSTGAVSKCEIRARSSTRWATSSAGSRATRSVPNSSTL